MSDFKIRVNVELDSSDIESKLKALGKDQKVEIDLKLKNLDDIKSQLNSLKTSFKNAFKLDSNFANDLNKIAKAMDKINSGGGGSPNKPKQQISNLISEYKDMYNTIEKLQKQLNKGGLGEESIARTRNQIAKMSSELNSLYSKANSDERSSLNSFISKQMNKDLVDMNNNLNKIESQANKLKKQASDIKLEFVSDSSKGELEKVLNTIDEIKSAAKSDIKLDIEVGEAINKLNDAKDAINKIQKESNENFKEQSKLIEKQSSGKGFKGFWEDYKNSIMAYSIGDILGDFTVDAIRGAMSTVMDLDKAFTDLRKVSDTPIEGKYYDSVRKQAIETAKEVGMSSSDVVQSVATAMQAGMGGIEQSMAVAKQAMILANVGDMNAEQAASAVSSMINAYKLDPLKEMQIQQKGVTKTTTELTNAMDMLNHASNNYAIDSAGLSNAIADVGSVLNSYGIGLGDSVGLITAANEAMQDPGKVATGLKSIAINMAGMQTSAKDGTITLNKTAKSLKEIAGIDVYANKQTGQMKNMVQILDELQGKWTTLSEEQQSALSVAIAGKTNAAVFQSLMGNYETFKQIQGEFAQGLQFGSAAAENEQYVDSISGKLNKLKETWTGIATTFIKSDFVKGALDGLNSISEVIQKIVSNDFGAFAVGFGALTTGIVGAVKGFSTIKDIFGTFSTFKDVLSGTKTIGTILDEAKLAKTATSATKLGTTIGKVGTAIKGTITELGLFSSVGATATTAVAAGFLALPFAIAGYVKYQEYATQKRMENSRQTIQSLQEEISANQKAVESVRGIAEEYDVLNLKRNKTNEEQQRHLELTRQIAEAFPDLVSGYDEAGNPILALNGSLETYIRNLDRAIEKQNQLMKSEQNSLANEWKNQVDDFKKQQKELDNWTAPSINTNAIKDVFTGQIDPKKLKTQIKEVEKAEQKHYDNALKYYEEYEKAKTEVNQSYQNKLEGLSGYKNSNDAEKQRVKDMMSNLDMYSVYTDKGETGTNKLMNAMLMLDDKLVSSTEEMGKHAEAIDKAEEAYGNTGNLDKYTDSITKAYEATGKIDTESFSNWVQGVKDYASTTGDLEGANRQIEKISNTLEKLSGVDSSIWESALKINVEPIEVAEQKLNDFLKTYNTSSMNVGKGGMADKIKMEFENMRELPTMLANELETNREISAEFLVNATVDMPTPIQELVKEIIEDGEVTEEEIEILINATTDIQNKGEISESTKEQIKSELKISDEEFEQRFTVKADVEVEAEIDDFLNSINAGNDVEFAIRCNVEGRDEAEALWQSLQSIPEEKRLQVVANYGEVKEAARQLGIDISNLPTQTIVDIATNVDNAQLETFLQAIEGIDGKTVSAFLQAEGAAEALAQCETVQQMLDLINTFIATGKIEIENEGKEEIEKTKSELDELDGKTVTADLLVQSDEGNLEQTKSALVEMDGKTYLAVVNVDTNETELVPFEGKLNEIDGKTATATVNVSPGDTSGIEKGKEVETLPNDKQISVSTPAGDTSGIEKAKEVEKLPSEKEVKVSITQKAGNVLDSISNFFKSKTEEKVSVSVQVTGKEQIESIKSSIASLQNKNINVNVNAGNATSLLNNIKSALNSMQTKTINVNLSGNALSQVNQIKSALNGLQTKNISINASGNALSQINSIKSALGGLQSKSISVNASVNGVGQVNALKSSIAGLQGKSVSVTASTSGVGQVNALTSAIGRVQGKSVSVTANVSGTGAVNALNSAISRVKSKSVKISASVSGTGAVQGLASAIANVRSKSVSVSASVTKTVTTVEKTVAQSVPMSVSTPMLMNTSLADIPVSASSPLDIPISASDNISPLASIPVSISAKANNDFGGTIDRDKILSMLDFNVSHIKDLTEALERLGNQLDFLDEKSEAVFGKEKINLLQQQIPLLREQQKIQEQIAKNERAQNNELTNWLSQQGFTFDNLGNITNYQDKLLSMEQNVDSLKKKYDALNDAKDKNEDATKSAQKAYEDANDALGKTKDYLEEYFTTNNKEIIEASKKWWEYENQIREVESAIRDVLNLELQRQIDAISDSIDFLDAKIDMMNSNDKIQYLEEQNRLYKEQQTLLHVLAQQMRTQLATLNPLSDEYADLASEIMGLSEKWWDLQSAISKNQSDIFDSRTNGLRNQLENLEDEIGFLDSKSDSYNGDNKINILEQQVGLYKEQQNQLHQLANELRYQLTLLDPQSEEYHEIASEIKKLSTEWWDVEKAIRDATDSVEEMKRELKLVTVDSALTELEVKFARLNFELDLIDEKMDYVWGTDKIDAMTESVSLLTKELDMQQEKLGLTNKKMAIYQEDLLKYGFQFDKMGNMTNYSSMMEIYKNGTEFDKLIDMTKEYMDLQEELQDLTLGYWEIDKKIKDTYKEQLEITQDIEDKITDIYEKEYEKRKKEIEDFTDERIKLLEKEKNAYKSLREEQDYNKSVKEQTDEIEKLNKLIETARRDTSISGQKRLKELMEQLAEAQEKLQETTQDKIDSDYESNIDNEIDRLEEEQDKLIGILDEKFSDENIAKMVAEAMANGFIEINGEVKSLQDALLQSINESAEGYSVMAQVIKNELVTNLNVALESMKELDNIYSNLGLNDYEGISSNVKTNMLTPSYSGNNSKNVTIGDTYLTISGNVSDDILEEIEQMIDEKNEKMLNEITANL